MSFSSAGFRFEVFNLDTKMLIGRTHLHEPVSFWTWLNSDIIAIVTDTAVFHWDLWQGKRIFLSFINMALKSVHTFFVVVILLCLNLLPKAHLKRILVFSCMLLMTVKEFYCTSPFCLKNLFHETDKSVSFG